jgi:hypothetical protein
MEDVNYDGLFGMMSENNKKQDAILVICKAIEKQQVNQPVSKEEVEAIVSEKVSAMENSIELKIKQQIENQTNAISKKFSALPVSVNGSFPQPKKIAFFGFEFLRTSVVIFSLSVAIFWSLVMNIKQMDDNKALKIQCNQLTESVMQLQKTQEIEKAEKPKVKKSK